MFIRSIINFRPADSIWILAGTNDLTSGGTRYACKNSIRHERYDDPKYAYDIGLIRVNGSIEFNAKIQPIKYSSETVPNGAALQTTGWGMLDVSCFFIIKPNRTFCWNQLMIDEIKHA